MKNVIFVAPWFAETTLRFIQAVARVPGLRVGLVSQDGVNRVPPGLRSLLAAHRRIAQPLDPAHILRSVEALSARMGPVHRLVGTLEELQVPLGQVRDQLGIPGMGAESARNFRDKARMKTVLREAGVPCARHALVSSAEAAFAFADAQGFPLIAKPPQGSGSRATYRLESREDLSQCLRAMPPGDGNPLLLEEFVVGDEYSFDSIFLHGNVVWYSINHYLPSPLEVLREPWIQWCVLLPREVDDPRYHEIRRVAGAALKALGMDNGLSHMEWFRRPDGSVAVSEVGARPPGARFVDLISQAHDFDLYDAWARATVFETFEPRPRPYAAGAVYLRAQGRGQKIGAVRGFGEVARELGPMLVEAKLPRAGQFRGGTYEGDGYLMVRHPETEAVQKALAFILRTVKVEPAEPPGVAS